MINLNLSYEKIHDNLQKWENDKSINPFTKRQIKLNGSTYINIDKLFINFKKYGIYKNNKKSTNMDYIIQNIFINKHFNKSYDLELKKYLYILVYLEFRTRELYLQYFDLSNINYENKNDKKGQPFKNVRLIFYELIKLNKIPNYTFFMIDEEISNDYIDELKILYKSYYETLKDYTFENKYIVSKKDIDFEKRYIMEEFKDTKEYFYKIDNLFDDNPKYNNIKKIHNTMNIDNLICDTCSKYSPKLLCNCGVNIYCNERCKKKDFKNHYENCKYIKQ